MACCDVRLSSQFVPSLTEVPYPILVTIRHSLNRLLYVSGYQLHLLPLVVWAIDVYGPFYAPLCVVGHCEVISCAAQGVGSALALGATVAALGLSNKAVYEAVAPLSATDAKYEDGPDLAPAPNACCCGRPAPGGALGTEHALARNCEALWTCI